MESVDRNAMRPARQLIVALSLSVWRAWIEIASKAAVSSGERGSLSVWRAWIEICMGTNSFPSLTRSLSVWRAWLEIYVHKSPSPMLNRSLSVWRAWIEMIRFRIAVARTMSLSVWRAWIEMFELLCLCRIAGVALRMESVDRNTLFRFRTAGNC